MAEAVTPPEGDAPDADASADAPTLVADPPAPTIESDAAEAARQRALDLDRDDAIDAEDIRRVAQRFRYAWIALAIGGLALVAGGLAFATTRSAPRDPAEFAGGWEPTGSGVEAAQSIGDHVGSLYLLEDGQPMVRITVAPAELEGQRLGGIAVQDDSQAGGYRIEPTDRTIVYRFCGDGEKCSIGSGEASEARGQILKREALEVALLAMNFQPKTERVVVLMPPKAGDDPSFAMLFERSEVGDLLDASLATVAPEPVPTPATLSPQESDRITTLTSGALFQFDYQVDEQQTPFLVLQPPSSATP